ncbi:MAG: PKD domain-containing protein, partial [Sphingobacteriales bacterium]
MRKFYALLLTFFLALAGSLQAQDSCRSEFNMQQMGGNTAPFVVNTIATAWNNHQRPVISLCWNWGDGSPQQCSQGTAANPPALNATHTFAANGTYTITLTVNHDGGCVSHFTRSIILPAPNTPPDSCRANFTHAILNAGAIAQLVAFNPQPWHSAQRPVTRICYQFGDGRDTCINYSGTTPAPLPVQHFYAQPGAYNTCVTMTYQGGCQSTSCHAVVLAAPPPPPPDSCRAEFTHAPWFQHPRGRTLTAHAWHNYQRPVTKICWQFGDGRDTCILYPSGYNGQPVFHDYPSPGTYNTCATIFYQGGCQSNRCQPVNVPPPPPDSCRTTITVQPVVATPMARRFIANPFHNNGRRVTRICWLFGDGRDTCINYAAATSNSFSVDHTFQQLGNYTV